MAVKLIERPDKPLDVRIHYQVYDQEGKLVEMQCPDSTSNRFLVLWLRQCDRYNGVGVV